MHSLSSMEEKGKCLRRQEEGLSVRQTGIKSATKTLAVFVEAIFLGIRYRLLANCYFYNIEGLSLTWFGAEEQVADHLHITGSHKRGEDAAVVLRPAVAKAGDAVHLLLGPKQLANKMASRSPGQWCFPTVTAPKCPQADCALSLEFSMFQDLVRPINV